MIFDLTGKRAIVTGASRGLGAAIAAAFREAGATTFCPMREDGYNLRNFGTAAAIMFECTKVFPQLDILVNCAAETGPIGEIGTPRLGDWCSTIHVNLMAPAKLCHLGINWMRKTKTAGSIINIGGGGACNPRPGYSAYATSKAGLVRFSETIAEECKPYGIRVNCVAPGLLNTRMGSPEGADPKRAAELVTWMASDASRPITGKLISAVHDPWPNLDRVLAKDPDMYTLRRVVP